jgi:hypothetical protein
MMLDRRLLDGDADGGESIPDLTNPLIVTEGGESGGHVTVLSLESNVLSINCRMAKRALRFTVKAKTSRALPRSAS